MSDEDRDVDIESDEEEDQDQEELDGAAAQPPIDKRAHHNALERKRRDHIKDSFHNLRDSVPTVHGEKVSRAQILKKAADYIQQLRDGNSTHMKNIESMKKNNQQIQTQISTETQGDRDRQTDWAERDRIKMLEKYSETAKYTEATRTRQQAKLQGAGPVSESSEEDDSTGQPSRKKPKQSVDS